MAGDSNKKVLFLEPNKNVRESIASIFRNSGMDITTTIAPDVGDARNKIKNNVFHIIFSEFDLGKGEKTGQQFLEELRIGQLISASTGFIIITTESERNKVLSTLEYRPDEYILKPFRQAEISQRLCNTLEKKDFFCKVYDLMFKGEYEKAVAELGILARTNKYPLDIIRLKLVCFLKKGDYQSVVAMYQEISSHKSLNKISQFPWFRYSYSKALYHLGRFQEAEIISSELKLRYPQYMENYKLLADILHSQKKDNLSLGILQQAVEFSPLNMERQLQFGKQALLQGDMEMALQAHQTVIQKGANSFVYTMDAHANMAHIYAEMGQFDEALKVLNDGVTSFAKKDPIGSKFTSAVMESQVHAKAGDQEKSQSAFQTALTLYNQKDDDPLNRLQISDEVKVFFSAECLENGEAGIAKSLIGEVIENGTHRQDQLEGHLVKVIRSPEKIAQVGKIMENAKTGTSEDIPEINERAEEVKKESARSMYDQIVAEDTDNSTQDFQRAMEMIEKGELHEAAQLLESVVQGDFNASKTLYDNVIEYVKNGDWKKAISLLKLEIIKSPREPRVYFDLAQLSFFYLEKKLETLDDDEYTYDKMFFQAQSYFEKGKGLLKSQNPSDYKTSQSRIELLIEKIQKKRQERMKKQK